MTELRKEQEKTINEISTGRVLWLLVVKHRFVLVVVGWVFTIMAWAQQTLPTALANMR